MPELLFWGANPDPWDRLEVNDLVFDETEVDVDFDFGNELDIKKAPGADGAPSNDKGYDPAKPKVTVLLYTQEHFNAYLELVKKYGPKPGKQGPSIVTVVHPELQNVGKAKFKLAKIHSLKKAGPQMKKLQLDLVEYFASPKPLGKPPNAKDANKDPNDIGPNRILVRAREDPVPSTSIKP